jgi:uncharacterized protein with ParB-like and HNH nuclease domain
MLSATKAKLLSFLNGSSQYIIPFFQRSYVWKIDSWGELWDNILEEYQELKDNPKTTSEHFIGTIIIKQMMSTQVGATEYELIDGQQRLTTICLLLKAFQDACEDEKAQNWIGKFLSFEDSYGNEKIRISHSKVDKEHFQSVIQDKNSNTDLWNSFKDLKPEEIEKKLEQENRIIGAYLYFRYKIVHYCDLNDIRSYINVIIERLPVIHMALNAEDDVQQIFDTINSLGVKLTTAELLKNLLYSKKSVIALYDDYWNKIFEADEDLIEFWNRERTSGRVRRTTVELFLYSYLVILKESSVKLETLFKEFKSYINGMDDDQLVSFAKDIKNYAEVYKDLPDGENLSEICFVEHDKRFFHVIREFEITTIFPLVLYVFKEVSDANERSKILNVLESYLTRRTVCKLNTKNYNNLFLSLLSEAKKMDSITADNLKEVLLKYKEETNRFPDNDEFEKAFHTAFLTNKYSREVLFCIALYQLNNDFTDNPKLNLNGFSVEHIMPKNWKKNWPNLPEETDEVARNYKLLTMGNLTLVKGKLNSAMRDSSWEKKKEALRKFSTLRQTTDYINKEDWSEAEMTTRAETLFQAALQIWKR